MLKENKEGVIILPAVQLGTAAAAVRLGVSKIGRAGLNFSPLSITATLADLEPLSD